MAKEIPLTQGKVALVDDDVYEELSQYKWYALKGVYTYYARRNIPCGDGKQTAITMHYAIMGRTRVDHRDGNGLNNQKSNLRFYEGGQNAANRRLPRNSTSGFKGVTWHKSNQKWRAQIKVNGKKMHLGHYATAEEAARAYDIAALKYFGEFARMNTWEAA